MLYLRFFSAENKDFQCRDLSLFMHSDSCPIVTGQ
ncbi:hypothetical protein BACOVA_00924 [Bacteroides ovatus ATCC 8483]|uniref:Uncharacterized protein n=1 Tax=Bacteroides ovatus (strain ATCC 8483 / DSM 1896 / JCM 5824 / BCRC 10623 / CCUG 4943 / NCTC 11153) TaxID=411476 RepID=A0AAN3ABU3_BACO1|nr:hypothetical protein BACOVA_00924 [Bacteroides ovatus ATCC 8483]